MLNNIGSTINFSQWDWGQIGIKLETKHVIYQKLENFINKNCVYFDRLENDIFGM